MKKRLGIDNVLFYFILFLKKHLLSFLFMTHLSYFPPRAWFKRTLSPLQVYKSSGHFPVEFYWPLLPGASDALDGFTSGVWFD